MANGVISCPHANRPGAQHNADKNFKKMYAKRPKKKSDWSKFGGDTKRKFMKTLLSDPGLREDFNKYLTEAREAGANSAPPCQKGAHGRCHRDYFGPCLE